MKKGDMVKFKAWWNKDLITIGYLRCDPYSYYNMTTGEKVDEYVDIDFNDDTDTYRIATLKTKDIIKGDSYF